MRRDRRGRGRGGPRRGPAGAAGGAARRHQRGARQGDHPQVQPRRHARRRSRRRRAEDRQGGEGVVSVVTDAIFSLSALTMIALWIATFVFARRRRTASKMITFYLGMFVVWPALAVSFGILLGQSALEGVDKNPVDLGVVYVFGFAFVVTLLTWLTGYALASIAGWFTGGRVAT